MKNELKSLDQSFAVVSIDEAREILGGASGGAGVPSDGTPPIDETDSARWSTQPAIYRWP